MPIIETVIAQHAEEAAFLWLLRDGACGQPHYRLKDLAKLDDRVEAHLDGLRIAGEEGRPVCDEVWAMEEAGELFAAAELAFEAGDARRVGPVLEVAAVNREASRGVISALGWLPHETARPHAEALVASEEPALRRVGLAACAVHRSDPGEALAEGMRAEDPWFRSRALRAVGELGRGDLLPALQAEVMCEDEYCRFWACWSAALFGDLTAVAVLKSFAGSPRYRDRAIQMAFGRMPAGAALTWREELARSPEFVRLAVVGAGAIGDPVTIPWLVEQMAVPALARPAGEAFSMITGVNIAYEDLDGEWPEGFAAGPTESSADEDVAMDPDEDLPWPDPEKIDRWWHANLGRFPTGSRYLCGELIAEESLRRVLREGYQRQRAAAALELAFLCPGESLFEVRAPGFRQRKMLGC